MKHHVKNTRTLETDLVREKYKDLMLENESRANLVISWVLFAMGVMYMVIGSLNVLGIAGNRSQQLYISLFVSALAVGTTSMLFQTWKNKTLRWFKYISFFIISLSILLLNIMTGYKLRLLYAVPVFLSVRYYDTRFTTVVAFYGMEMSVASAFTNAYLSGLTRLVDLNLISFSEPGTVSYSSWLHNGVIEHGFDKGTVVFNGLSLMVIPDLFIILLLTLIAVKLAKNSAEILMKESIALEKQIQLLRDASIDSLTGLRNRRAYNRDRAAIEVGALNNLVLVMFDVNGLKCTNDSCGHVAGDELITGAAECIRKTCEPYGNVYRWGGDEFAAIIYTDSKTLMKIKQEFLDRVAAWRGKEIERLSVSAGYAAAWEMGTDFTIDDIEALADKRMYEIKKSHYADTSR